MAGHRRGAPPSAPAVAEKEGSCRSLPSLYAGGTRGRTAGRTNCVAGADRRGPAAGRHAALGPDLLLLLDPRERTPSGRRHHPAAGAARAVPADAGSRAGSGRRGPPGGGGGPPGTAGPPRSDPGPPPGQEEEGWPSRPTPVAPPALIPGRPPRSEAA